MRKLIVFGAGLLLAASIHSPRAGASGAQGIEGTWMVDSRDAYIEIAPCDEELCGRLVWLEKPYEKDGTLKIDDDNPDPGLRQQKLLGLSLLQGFPKKPNSKGLWTGGTIYDPENGKTYKCQISKGGPGELKIRGYIGISFIGRTTIWTQAPKGKPTTGLTLGDLPGTPQ